MSALRNIDGGAAAPIARESAEVMAEWMRRCITTLETMEQTETRKVTLAITREHLERFERAARPQPALRLIQGGRAGQ